MLERYYARPRTVDRIRALWLGPAIDRYVEWLTARQAEGTVKSSVQRLVHFNRFAQSRGATAWKSCHHTWSRSLHFGCKSTAGGAGRHKLEPTCSRGHACPLSNCFDFCCRTSWERSAVLPCRSKTRSRSCSSIWAKSAAFDHRRWVVTGTTSGPLKRISNGSAAPTCPVHTHADQHVHH